LGSPPVNNKCLRPTTMVLRTSTLGDELLVLLWALLD